MQKCGQLVDIKNLQNEYLNIFNAYLQNPLRYSPERALQKLCYEDKGNRYYPYLLFTAQAPSSHQILLVRNLLECNCRWFDMIREEIRVHGENANGVIVEPAATEKHSGPAVRHFTATLSTLDGLPTRVPTQAAKKGER